MSRWSVADVLPSDTVAKDGRACHELVLTRNGGSYWIVIAVVPYGDGFTAAQCVLADRLSRRLEAAKPIQVRGLIAEARRICDPLWLNP